jgi:hypothetical protein
MAECARFFPKERSMNVRAKMVVGEVTKVSWNPEARKVKLHAQYSSTPEDNSYAKATPTGSIEMQVDNPPVAKFFEENLGKAFYVDFVPVPEASEKSAA